MTGFIWLLLTVMACLKLVEIFKRGSKIPLQGVTGIVSTRTNPLDLEKAVKPFAAAMTSIGNSSRLQRKLDEYGVVVDVNKMKAVGDNCPPIVFAQKDAEGKYNIGAGMYISDGSSGDGYGDFRFYGGRV